MDTAGREKSEPESARVEHRMYPRVRQTVSFQIIVEDKEQGAIKRWQEKTQNAAWEWGT